MDNLESTPASDRGEALTHNATDERTLAELHAARRNRYYYGKLMDVLHCSMEQQYVLRKEWLYNRMVLGPGVVCGLGVEPTTTAAGVGIIVRAGIAIDGSWRTVIVPDDVVIAPLALTDDCGAPQPASDAPLPTEVTIGLCYQECLTDWAPSIVSDCGCGCAEGCEAGTVVESYCIKVSAGQAPAVDEPCAKAVMSRIKEGALHELLCELSNGRPPAPQASCLALANIRVDEILVSGVGVQGAKLSVDAVTPRRIVPTNQILMQLIRCLAECCPANGEQPPQTPSLLHVSGVRILSTWTVTASPSHVRGPIRVQGSPQDADLPEIGQLASGKDTITVKAAQSPDVVEVAFDAAYDQNSIVLSDSFQVIKKLKTDQLIKTGSSVRLYRKAGFKPGKYQLRLIGNAGDFGSTQAILASVGTRLDGEGASKGLPSGDGSEGGNFTFTLMVEP